MADDPKFFFVPCADMVELGDVLHFAAEHDRPVYVPEPSDPQLGAAQYGIAQLARFAKTGPDDTFPDTLRSYGFDVRPTTNPDVQEQLETVFNEYLERSA